MSVLQMVQKNMTLIFLQRSLLFLCTNKSVCLHMLVPLVFLSSFCSLKLNDFNFKNGHWATFSSACKAEVIQGYADASPNWKLSLLVTVMCLLLCVCPYATEKSLLMIFTMHFAKTSQKTRTHKYTFLCHPCPNLVVVNSL